MKKYFLGLALLAIVSAVAIQGLHARTTTPPVYVVHLALSSLSSHS
jgi:hypothetical protein